jgi:hypothetical protein
MALGAVRTRVPFGRESALDQCVCARSHKRVRYLAAIRCRVPARPPKCGLGKAIVECVDCSAQEKENSSARRARCHVSISGSQSVHMTDCGHACDWTVTVSSQSIHRVGMCGPSICLECPYHSSWLNTVQCGSGELRTRTQWKWIGAN